MGRDICLRLRLTTRTQAGEWWCVWENKQPWTWLWLGGDDWPPLVYKECSEGLVMPTINIKRKRQSGVRSSLIQWAYTYILGTLHYITLHCVTLHVKRNNLSQSKTLTINNVKLQRKQQILLNQSSGYTVNQNDKYCVVRLAVCWNMYEL